MTRRRRRRPDPSKLARRAETATRDLAYTEMALRAKTIDKDNRSIEATLVTNRRTLIRDPFSGRPIHEIILADALHWARHMVLLDTHGLADGGIDYGPVTVEAVLGSVREIRREDQVWVGRLVLARDEKSEAAWSKLVDGHLRAVSVGYRQRKYVDILPGETQTVRGISYTADPRILLRITTDARAHEVSLTPIGADAGTTTRTDANHPNPEPTPMDPALRTYLQSLGLAADATDPQANEYHEGLRGAHHRFQPDTAQLIPIICVGACEQIQRYGLSDQVIRSEPNHFPRSSPQRSRLEVVGREAVIAEQPV